MWTKGLEGWDRPLKSLKVESEFDLLEDAAGSLLTSCRAPTASEFPPGAWGYDVKLARHRPPSSSHFTSFLLVEALVAQDGQ